MITKEDVLTCIENDWEINTDKEFESDYLRLLVLEYQMAAKRVYTILEMIENA